MILIINDHGCSVRKGRYCHNIACISVVVIATIVIPIVVIYSGGETTNGTILAEFRCFSEGILL